MNNSDNNDRPERNQQSIQEKTLNYILSNLLSVLSATSLLVGGLIFWLYFFNIQYFPDLNFNESVLFLLVAAITGVIIIVVLAILIIIPYILHSLVLKQQNHTGLSNDEDLTPHQQPPPIDPEKFNYFENFWYFLSMFIVCYVIFLEFFLKPYIEFKWMLFAYLSFLIVLLVNLFIYDGVCKHLKKLREKAPKNPKPMKPMRGVWAWIVSIIILMLVFIAVINHIVFNENSLLVANKNSLPLAFSVVFLLIFFANIMFAYYVDEQKNIVLAVIFIILIVLSLFFLGDVNIPKKVMKMYKFGNFETQQLLVNEEGCKILKHLELIPDNDKNKTTCHVNDVKILSRLGRSFYLDTTFLCKPPWLCRPLNFTIPNNHILSWSVTTPPERYK